MSNKDKVFLTYKQQIQLMRRKRVLISDEKYAREVLSSISYYNIINGYKDIFETYRDEDDDNIEKFIKKVTLENLHKVHLIDTALNNLLFKYIIYIENTLKTKIAYNIAKDFGLKQSEYLNFTKYTDSDPLDRKQVISKVISELDGNKNNYPIQHYKSKPFIPPWIAVKGIYFGTTVNWYKVLIPKIKERIAEEFCELSLLKNIEDKKEFLIVVLNLLHEYRNNIAHGSRTFLSNVSAELNKDLLLKSVSADVLTEDEFTQGIGKSDLFAVIVSIAILINDKAMFEQYLRDLFIISLDYKDSSIALSPKGNIYKTLNVPENFIDRITTIYNMKFAS
ncbi:Abi family protein [Lactococcus chungangensis]|uniref:Abi family protein n=1 Tax=Pseudolactococcus chungangensis TaxID=451457 RepID=UPI0037363A29